MKTRRPFTRLAGIFVFITTLTGIVSADTKTKKVDELFAKWDSTVSPGAALAVIQDGEITYKRGYGMANLEHNIPITSETVFRIGSSSKQFTAACIAILSLQGKISLDDDIRKYVPELPEYENPITVRHLVHHTSGLRDYLTLSILSGVSVDDFFPPEDTLAQLSRQNGLNFIPGDEHLYSNSGYFLMGVIVSRVSGQSLPGFAREHIFKPLGMKNTHFHDDYTMIVKNRADGHTRTKGGFNISNTTLNHVGDGGVFTTVEDLFLWDQAFYNCKLGKELMDLMYHTGALNNGKRLEYAFGLFVSQYKGLNMVAHGGAFVGFRAEMIRFQEEKFSVICLANLDSINPSRLCNQVADIYLAGKLKAEDPAGSTAAKTSPVILTKRDLENKTGKFIATRGSRVANISLKEGNLIITGIGEKLRLIPLSKSEFTAKDAPVEITFSFSPPDKKALNVKVTLGGDREIDLKRAPEMPPLTIEQIQAYAGFYTNDELPATYSLVAEKDKLIFTHRNAPKAPLKLLDKDTFLSGLGRLEFTRGKDKKITGFYLDAGRVRIQFARKQTGQTLQP